MWQVLIFKKVGWKLGENCARSARCIFETFCAGTENSFYRGHPFGHWLQERSKRLREIISNDSKDEMMKTKSGGCRKGESPGKPGGWWSAAGTSTTASDRRPSAQPPSWDWEIQFPSWCFSKAPGVHITRYVVAWHRWHIVTRWTRPVQMQC